MSTLTPRPMRAGKYCDGVIIGEYAALEQKANALFRMTFGRKPYVPAPETEASALPTGDWAERRQACAQCRVMKGWRKFRANKDEDPMVPPSLGICSQCRHTSACAEAARRKEVRAVNSGAQDQHVERRRNEKALRQRRRLLAEYERQWDDVRV